MNNSFINEKIISKLEENINFSKKKGMIIASPSSSPPYKFHWIRDAALVMRAIVDLYKKTKEDKYLMYIINYLENEAYIQNLDTISGLGEPKVNIDGTPFNDSWGRPQNDGPALRGILLFDIYDILKNDYPNLVDSLVVPIIQKDIDYIVANLKKPSFDLWEEIYGWHFYTRLVQAKFIKEYINHSSSIFNKKLDNIYKNFLVNLKDHLNGNTIISSFDTDGNIVRIDDGSVLLAFCHVKYEQDILDIFPLEFAKITAENLISDFRKKYNLHNLNLIGRYNNDAYFDGQLWFICSLGISQVYYKLSENTEYKDLSTIAHNIFNDIISIDVNYNFAEQYNPVSKEQLSAEKLTWNYVELYMTSILIN